MTNTYSYPDNPLVSVIVPVYNMQDYLKECIDSIAGSRYQNIEIVVVDDGSEDQSLDTAKVLAVKWSERCRILVIHQQNKGVSSARNTAIANASGEFILPVDGDDRISPELIGLAVEEFKKDDQVKVVIPKAEFFGEKRGAWVLPQFSLKLLARKNYIFVTALYRKRDWANIQGYCEDFKGFEDWDFWISMLKEGGKVVNLDTVGFYYRKRKGSKRSSDRKYKKDMVRKLNERHSEFFFRMLGGPLHYYRSWSRLINSIERI